MQIIFSAFFGDYMITKILSKSFVFAPLLFSFFLASCGANPQSEVNSSVTTSDIVNGKALTKKNPISHSIVALVFEKANGQALCTGSLISSNVVLTAAHCVEDHPERMTIVFSQNVQKSKPEERRLSDKYVQHPNWQRHLNSGEGDLALVHFTGDLPKGFSPIKLVDANYNLKMGQKIIMAGFGVTDGETESGSGKLRLTHSTLIDQHSATEFVSDGKKTSVCFGDSGGPAFIQEGDRLLQWGVASSVTNQACNEASIHTAIMNYENWIKSNIAKLK